MLLFVTDIINIFMLRLSDASSQCLLILYSVTVVLGIVGNLTILVTFFSNKVVMLGLLS